MAAQGDSHFLQNRLSVLSCPPSAQAPANAEHPDPQDADRPQSPIEELTLPLCVPK